MIHPAFDSGVAVSIHRNVQLRSVPQRTSNRRDYLHLLCFNLESCTLQSRALSSTLDSLESLSQGKDVYLNKRAARDEKKSILGRTSETRLAICRPRHARKRGRDAPACSFLFSCNTHRESRHVSSSRCTSPSRTSHACREFSHLAPIPGVPA